MTNDKGIFIKNVYYMLSYAFRALRQDGWKSVAVEDFASVQDLLAAILAKASAQQLKQGLHREYVTQRDMLPVLRGKIDLPETVRCRTVWRSCSLRPLRGRGFSIAAIIRIMSC